MLRFSLAGASLAVLLAACEQPGPETETATAPPAAEATTETAEADTGVDLAAVPFTWAGSELETFGNITVAAEEGAETAILTRTGSEEDVSGGRTSGAYVMYRLARNADLSGLVLDISVTAKATTEAPAPFMVAYSTAGAGNSGWMEFEATSEFATYSFPYEVADVEDTSPDFIGVSVPEGVAIEVESISLGLSE